MRVRLRFTKLGKVRYISHRDVARVWERALRRARLPIALTEGFSPRPKVHFGLALSTGHESLGEYLDVDLAEGAGGADVDLDALPPLLSAALPVGMDVQAAAEVDRRAASLQQAVTSCTWRVEVVGVGPEEAEALARAALDAPSLPLTRSRKGQEGTDDLRPHLRSLAVIGPTDRGVELEAELGTQPRALRPSELVAVAFPGPGHEEGRVRRTHQWIEHDGARREPLPLPQDATSAPHARGVCV
ncbi:MAG TPA: TIGR03936 family radical SAM-associated protein [Acidimicrobiales bacterium]